MSTGTVKNGGVKWPFSDIHKPKMWRRGLSTATLDLWRTSGERKVNAAILRHITPTGVRQSELRWRARLFARATLCTDSAVEFAARGAGSRGQMTWLPTSLWPSRSNGLVFPVTQWRNAAPAMGLLTSFGDLNAYGPNAVRFDTPRKTLTQRWPANGSEIIQFAFNEST
jgi:hypothetical protein